MTDVIAACGSNHFRVVDFDTFKRKMTANYPEVVVTEIAPNIAEDTPTKLVHLHTVYGNWPEVDSNEEECFYQIVLDHTEDGAAVLTTVTILEPGNIGCESISLRSRDDGLVRREVKLITTQISDIERLHSGFLSSL